MVGFLGGTVVKNLPANVGDMGLIPGSRTFPGEGIGYPLQYSGLENPMDRGYSPWGCNRVRHNSSAKLTTSTHFVVVAFFVQNTSCNEILTARLNFIQHAYFTRLESKHILKVPS